MADDAKPQIPLWVDDEPHMQPVVQTMTEGGADYQSRVQPWLVACFGPEVAGDREERSHRFLEEALELVQATGCTADEAHALVEYVFQRPAGETSQEVGGVMLTLAALCLANGFDMRQAGEVELARVWTKIGIIRAKQAAKPRGSAAPQAWTSPESIALAAAQAEVEALKRPLMAYRAAVQWIAADSWDGCSDCMDVLKAASNGDWRKDPMSADEHAKQMKQLRMHKSDLPGGVTNNLRVKAQSVVDVDRYPSISSQDLPIAGQTFRFEVALNASPDALNIEAISFKDVSGDWQVLSVDVEVHSSGLAFESGANRSTIEVRRDAASASANFLATVRTDGDPTAPLEIVAMFSYANRHSGLVRRTFVAAGDR